LTEQSNGRYEFNIYFFSLTGR